MENIEYPGHEQSAQLETVAETVADIAPEKSNDELARESLDPTEYARWKASQP